MIRWIVLVQYLQDKVSPTEVGNGPREARSTPHESQEQRPFLVGEFLHHFPEPLHQRSRRLHTLVGGNSLQ